MFKEIVAKIKKNPLKFVKNIPIEKLEQILRRFAYLYYNSEKGSPISDETFDIMKEYLELKDPKNKFLKEIGTKLKQEESVRLPFPMSSLEKIKPEKNKLIQWMKKYNGPYIISDKLDGTSLQLYKNNNGEVKLYTRGDYTYGKDVSHLINFIIKDEWIKNLPKNTSVRGELIMSKENFEKIKNKYANARTATNSLVVAKKNLDFDVLDLTEFVTHSILYPRYKMSKQMKLLEEYKFNVVNYVKLDIINESILNKQLELRRKKGKYDIDGIVVFDNSKVYKISEKLPKYAFAYKMIFDDQIRESMVLKVIWQKSKDGYLKPKVEINPVEIGGTIVKYATAFNAKYIVDNMLGPCSIIKILKSGDIIPYILEVVKGTKADMPIEKYKWNESHVDIILDNTHDNEVISKRIEYFFKTMRIDNIGIGVIKKLVDNSYDSIFKILEAFKNRKNLYDIEGFGKISIDKIYNNIIEKFNNIDINNLMSASQLFGRGIGSRKLKLITDEYNILDNVYEPKELRNIILNIKGFDEKTTKKIVEGYYKFLKFYKKLKKLYNISIKKKTKKITNKFKNQNIVFTGFRNKELENVINNEGGNVKTSISKNISLVIYKDKNEKSSKLIKAEKLNIPIIQLNDFLIKYNIIL